MNNGEKWSVYEAMLQQYRILFLTSQTFLLAVGAIVFSKDTGEGLLAIIAVIALLQIWCIWFRVVRARALIVDYHKFQMEGLGKDEFRGIKETTYVRNKKKREKINTSIGKRNWRCTRIKIDLILPITTSIIWVLLAGPSWLKCVSELLKCLSRR